MSWRDPLIQIIAVLAGSLILTMWVAILAPHIGATRVRQLVAGVKVPPLLVAWLRRGLTALFALIIVWISNQLGFDEGKDQIKVGIVAGGLAEAAWGLLDQILKPAQNNENPPAVAGGGKLDLLEP